MKNLKWGTDPYIAILMTIVGIALAVISFI